MVKSDKTKADRIEKYQVLINAGFSAKEANVYKDRSWDFIEVLIDRKARDLDQALQLISNLLKGKNDNDT